MSKAILHKTTGRFPLLSCLSLLLLGSLVVGAMALTGCDAPDTVSPEAVPPEIAQARQRYLVADEPTDSILVTDARKMPAGSPMVIVGRLGVAGLPTWEAGKAMFMVADAHPQVAGHTHDEGEKESDCVFCKRSRNERLAMIQIVDDKGEIASIDAQRLLGVKEGAEVVVRGTGEVNSLDVLVITADAIHLR